jgi:hypothetical protein
MANNCANIFLAAMLGIASAGAPCVLSAQDGAPMARDKASPELPAQDTDKTTRLTVQVLDEATKKPIYNAHVVVRFEVDRRLRRDKRVSWEAKANQRGEVIMNAIPRGSIKVQVIAKGYRTYGDQHELTEPEQTVTISMQQPSGQQSAY